MITLIPCLEILKAFFDNNINSADAKIRVESFEIANQLTVECNFDILIPSQMFERVTKRFEPDHITAFETLYRIDNSTKNVTPEYNLDKAVNLLAKAESKVRGVIILTENVARYSFLTNNDRIRIVTPKIFNLITTTVRTWKKKGQISSVDDVLWVNFFRKN